MKRETIVQIICYSFILLFMYTAISKLLAFNVTEFDMHRNPILGDYPRFWAVSVPVAEIIVSVLLFFVGTRRLGLWLTLLLMVGFTGYVGVLLASDYHLPCTCGGIFRQLTWTQHLYVNIGLTAIAIVGIVLNGQGRDGKMLPYKDFIAR
ncbi:MauE/DoxX family redox-associated membrane protein [Sphingobacterium spiritivorum]|uniref:MauE/DoxX family redox-associated membrane protein n=1 Tax=Sphingobacterium spiritivorum TaxID=258 RepID=UPI003DA6B3FC